MSVSEAAQDTFIRRLHGLELGERRGELALLRRHAGKTLGESGDALELFYRLLPEEVGTEHHETFFLVATLFPITASRNVGNVGASLKRFRTKDTQKGLDRRLSILLDADDEQLPYRLRQMVRRIESLRGGVNWRNLLRDLLQWNDASRKVQREWAMAYFSGTTSSNSDIDSEAASESPPSEEGENDE